jgi:transposase
MNKSGKVLCGEEVESKFSEIQRVLQPYLPSIAIACECTFNWYWLADGCHEKNIEFYLGHALYMKVIHGTKKKNDALDAKKIAHLLRSNLFPLAYAYPKEMRTTRDLLRRRHMLVRLRAGLYRHLQIYMYQQGIENFPSRVTHEKKERKALVSLMKSRDAAYTMDIDVNLVDYVDQQLPKLEYHILKQAKSHDYHSLMLLQSIKGVGDILGLTILYEMHTVERFQTAQQFSSYCRVVKLDWESAHKKGISKNQKIGNPWLRWAFGELAVTSLRFNPEIVAYHEKLQRRFSKSKAFTILAHKFAIAVYYMLKNKEVFDVNKFIGA